MHTLQGEVNLKLPFTEQVLIHGKPTKNENPLFYDRTMSMMGKLTQQQENKVLIAVLAILALLIVYRVATTEKPKTAPFAFPPGSVARSAVRQSPVDNLSGADPLNILIAKRKERYPGVSRDIFRMENPAPKPAPVIVAPAVLPPAPPQKTPGELAAELSRADLAKFRFLGYLTDKDKNTMFLSKDGELLIVKSGDTFGKNYQVTKATKDYVVLLDTITRVEMRFDLAGGDPQPQQPTVQQMQRPTLQPAHQPAQSTAWEQPAVSEKPLQQPQPSPQSKLMRRRVFRPVQDIQDNGKDPSE